MKRPSMKRLRQFFIRLGSVFTAHRADDRLNAEIEEHILLQTEENIRAGMRRQKRDGRRGSNSAPLRP